MAKRLLCLFLVFIFIYIELVQAADQKGCVTTTNDRAYLGAAVEYDLQIYPNTVSESHADYTFSYKFNKTLNHKYGDKVYAQVNFTNFLKATSLTLVPGQIQCKQQRYMQIELCEVI